MSWSGHHRSKKRDSYHHGNLREALIAAALDLIAQKGPFGFTIAEAARAAGVSSAAPYRHFKDRDDLMSDIAKQGFIALEKRLQDAWNDGRPRPYTALEHVGRAYLDFARREPAMYTAMFEAGVAVRGDSELIRTSDAAFAVLRSATEAIADQIPAENRPPALMMALHIWSLSHGIASLFARGDEARRSLPMSPEDLLEAGVLVYLKGLGYQP